jgi:type VI secretion system secreted protein Hcp
MAFDAFIKIDNAPGECTDDKHKDWIEVLSFSLGVVQHAGGSASDAGGQSGGRADISDFSFMHRLDKSATKIDFFCARGEPIKTIVMELCRAGGDKNKYMEYKFSDCMISSSQVSGSSGAEDVPMKSVTFRFAKVEWTYTEYDKKTNAKKGDVKQFWDRSLNKGG